MNSIVWYGARSAPLHGTIKAEVILDDRITFDCFDPKDGGQYTVIFYRAGGESQVSHRPPGEPVQIRAQEWLNGRGDILIEGLWIESGDEYFFKATFVNARNDSLEGEADP